MSVSGHNLTFFNQPSVPFLAFVGFCGKIKVLLINRIEFEEELLRIDAVPPAAHDFIGYLERGVK